jgi:hypothetical protein
MIQKVLMLMTGRLRINGYLVVGSLILGGYVHAQIPLETTPSWTSTPSNNTLSVDWGDMNGDSLPDLACANAGENTVYLNLGGVLETSPSWSSALFSNTASVAWGDVDDDGDLDLACGNLFEANTVYLNNGGILDTLPYWSSAFTNLTNSVAWGDIDGDGDLDLACGNQTGPNTVYRNINDTLSLTPYWSSTPFNNTFSVAWGDVNGDSLLDLANGNNFGSNTVYLNLDTLLELNPTWSSIPPNNTSSIALGDMNGDSLLDLACGNTGQVNTVYLNTGSSLVTSPSWSSSSWDTMGTFDISWGDANGDGAPDLACGNLGESNVVYENQGNTLDTLSSWFSIQWNSTGGVDWGDVDGDGDLDLACGNSGQENTVYYNNLIVGISEKETKPNARGPIVLYQNNPNPFTKLTAISYRIPNSYPASRISPASPSGGNHVSLKLYDTTGRLVKVLVDAPQEPGFYQLQISNQQLPSSGHYFYRLISGDFEETKKLIYVR